MMFGKWVISFGLFVIFSLALLESVDAQNQANNSTTTNNSFTSIIRQLDSRMPNTLTEKQKLIRRYWIIKISCDYACIRDVNKEFIRKCVEETTLKRIKRCMFCQRIFQCGRAGLSIFAG